MKREGIKPDSWKPAYAGSAGTILPETRVEGLDRYGRIKIIKTIVSDINENFRYNNETIFINVYE